MIKYSKQNEGGKNMGLFDTITTSSSLSTASTSWSTTNDLLEEPYSRDSVLTTYIGISSSIATGGLTEHKVVNIEIAQNYVDPLSEVELAQLTTLASEKYDELIAKDASQKVLK